MSTHDTMQHATGQPHHGAHPHDGADCHCGSGSSKTLVAGSPRIALAGAPNAGKTSIYNALTGLHAKTRQLPRCHGPAVPGNLQDRWHDPRRSRTCPAPTP